MAGRVPELLRHHWQRNNDMCSSMCNRAERDWPSSSHRPHCIRHSVKSASASHTHTSRHQHPLSSQQRMQGAAELQLLAMRTQPLTSKCTGCPTSSATSMVCAHKQHCPFSSTKASWLQACRQVLCQCSHPHFSLWQTLTPKAWQQAPSKQRC